MTLTAEAIARIEQLTKDAAGKTVTIDGVEYSTTSLHDMREAEPTATTLGLHTLTALHDYVEANRDALEPPKLLFHVESPTSVALVTGLYGRFRQREVLVRAKAKDLFADVRSPMGQEELVTLLQSRCLPTPERGELLRIVGNVTEEGSADYKDDGITQTVTARTGVAVKEEVEVKNPWKLAPFRTFREVAQPESPFILRIKKGHHGPTFGLHECDGGAWQLEAVQNVAAWLKAANLGIPVLA